VASDSNGHEPSVYDDNDQVTEYSTSVTTTDTGLHMHKPYRFDQKTAEVGIDRCQPMCETVPCTTENRVVYERRCSDYCHPMALVANLIRNKTNPTV